MTDRRTLIAALTFVLAMSVQHQNIAARQTSPPSALIDDLVAANRILAMENVLDAMGHVSVRHPSRPDRFLLARSMPPELVTAADILELDLDGNPVDASGRTSYLERFIHSEIYRARPDVQRDRALPHAIADPIRGLRCPSARHVSHGRVHR